MKLLISGAFGLVAFAGCSGSASSGSSSSIGTGGAPSSTGASTGGTSGGTASGSSVGSSSGVGTPTFVVQPPAGQSFSSMSLSAASGEAELFYAESQSDGTYLFELRHLSASGSGLGTPVEVASGSPQQPPATTVASDGREIACCWEDYGTDPNPYGGGGSVGDEPAPLVLCNSVPVGGSDTDLAMDGGFIATGNGPMAATNAGDTIVVFEQSVFGLEQEWLYQPWGYGDGIGPLYVVTGFSVAPVPGGFDVFASDGGQLDYTCDGLEAQYEKMLPLPVQGAGEGAFATASSGDAVGLLIHEGAAVASVVMSADAGTVSTETILSAPGNVLTPAVAATTCAGGEFGFAYALVGGDIMFRQVEIDGSPLGTQSTLVASLGVTATGIALAPGDGGLLLAVGTADKIAVFGVACP